jgi:hypothetical protein
MKNRSEDNVEITTNQSILKLFVVHILQRVVKRRVFLFTVYLNR